MIGETVIAIGNPFGLQHTVTTGIISVRYLTIDPVTQVITVDENQNPGPSHYEYIH